MSKCFYICSKKKLSALVENRLNEICVKFAPYKINPSCNQYLFEKTKMHQVCALYSDFSNLQNYKKFGLSPNDFPQHLGKRYGKR